MCSQTDIMDLLGSDLPVESEEGIKFAWSDGILLQVAAYFVAREFSYICTLKLRLIEIF